MKGPLSQVVLIAAAIVPSALCAVSSYTQQLCKTSLGTKQVTPVPTSTRAFTLTFRPSVVSTSTPVVTVTPKPATLFTTVFTTTTIVAPVVTDTFSTTSTQIDTETVQVTPSITITNTETTTTTLPTPTTTVPTSPGFVPVISASATLAPRNLLLPRYNAPKKAPPKPSKSCHYDDDTHSFTFYPQPLYPTSVNCGQLVEVFSYSTRIVTATTTATQNAATPTATDTVTGTITATSVPVDASTTLSFSTTTTVTTTNVNPTFTNTVTTTQTVSVTPPQATYYAACDPATNQVSQVGGFGIDTFAYTGNFNFFGDGKTAPYDCCVACIKDANCGASFDVAGLCTFITPQDTCGGPNTFAGYYYGGQTAGLSPTQGFTVSDGNCGQASSGGLD